MSLLMDALKKAEAAKRQTAQTEHGPLPEPSPAETAEPGDMLPELPRELSVLDDQFATPHGAVSAAARGAPSGEPGISDSQRDREAAHNLFTAKRSPSRTPFWIGLTASTLTAVAAIALWFWWQLRPAPGALQTGPALAHRASATPGPPPPMQPAPVSEPKPPVMPLEIAAAPSPRTAVAKELPPTPARPSTDRPRSAPHATSARTGSADPTRAGVFTAAPQPSEVESAGEPRVRRATVSRERIAPAVARGYEAYVAGDMANAKRHYEDALRADPHSLDALNGMAAIALRAGRRDLAETYLSRSIESDPRDAYALAALASIKGQSDPQAAASRLRSMISAAPESPAAHFGLGNLYARDGRWADANQAYFRAFTSDPDNPDYLFNLAVSLDHLRQSKLALQYYQSALAAARPGAFDRQHVAARIRDLQQFQ